MQFKSRLACKSDPVVERYIFLLRWLRVITNSGDKFLNVLLFNRIIFTDLM